ncbi:MAG: PEP-CTERM sorting domain-containing protein [bacterium]
MNIPIKRAAFALLLAGLTTHTHAAVVAEWSGAQEIRDNDASGVAYSFTLSGQPSEITGISVSLSVSGGWNGDLYAYLSHGDGFAVLLNRVGVMTAGSDGYGNTGFDVTLSSGAGADIHSYQGSNPSYNESGQLTGNWAADGRFLDPTSSVRANTLDVFINGLNPNGLWTLFIADLSGGELSTLTSWKVDIVPEPSSLALLLAGALALVSLSRRRVKKLQG